MADRTINQLTAVANVAAADEFEVQKSGETTSKKATLAQLTLLEATARANADDAIELASGLNTNGTYPSMTQSWYLKAADFVNGLTDSGGAEANLVESLYNAIRLLDYQTYINSSSSTLINTEVTVSAAEVLALNTVPKVLITPPTGYVVDLHNVVIKLNFNTTPYSHDSYRCYITYTSGNAMFEFANAFIESAANTIYRGIKTASGEITLGGVGATVELIAEDSNPTAGNSTLTVYLTYRLIPFVASP